jgi:ureidoacrylate peracid hydrolase
MSNSAALLVIDIQNDDCHPEGVYSKHGLFTPNITKIVPNIIETMHFCKQAQIPVIATQLTVLEDLKKTAIGLGSFKTLRPFLNKEGFREKTWGHDLLEDLPEPNYRVKKWGLSAFYQTELEKYLSALEIETLILSGFTTNGAVETLAREAMGRYYKIITLTDCVATYSESLNQASLSNLVSFGKILLAKEWMQEVLLTIS